VVATHLLSVMAAAPAMFLLPVARVILPQ
jgi:hypothetical protein